MIALITDGFWKLLETIFGEISETAKKDAKSAVIIFQFVVIVCLSILLINMGSDWRQDKEKTIQRLLKKLEPRIERKINRSVEKETDKINKSVNETNETLKELKEVIITK